MSAEYFTPFVGKSAFDKMAQENISFSTRSDAMIASLLLFHDIPFHAMNLFLDIIKHPDFDPSEVSFNNSADVIQAAEKTRIENRLVAVQKRSNFNEKGETTQTKFPQFILDEVIDIFKEERRNDVYYGEFVGQFSSSLLSERHL